MKNRVKELRTAKGMKQAELAKYLGVAQNTLSYWENDKYDIDNKSLQKLADFFGCSVDYILGIDTSTQISAKAQVTDKDIMFALFGGAEDITPEMYEEVKRFAQYVKERNKNEQSE